MTTPVISKARPYTEAKIKAGAVSSVQAWTGTATRTSKATGTATLQNVAEALKALIDDLQARGITQ